MSTTDTSTPVVQNTNPVVQNPPVQDEFDFGITQGGMSVQDASTGVAASAEESVMSEEMRGVQSQEVSSAQDFDFSLDLPDQYDAPASAVEPSVSSQEENVVAEQASSLETQSDIPERTQVAPIEDIVSSPAENPLADQNFDAETTVDQNLTTDNVDDLVSVGQSVGEADPFQQSAQEEVQQSAQEEVQQSAQEEVQQSAQEELTPLAENLSIMEEGVDSPVGDQNFSFMHAEEHPVSGVSEQSASGSSDMTSGGEASDTALFSDQVQADESHALGQDERMDGASDQLTIGQVPQLPESEAFEEGRPVAADPFEAMKASLAQNGATHLESEEEVSSGAMQSALQEELGASPIDASPSLLEEKEEEDAPQLASESAMLVSESEDYQSAHIGNLEAVEAPAMPDSGMESLLSDDTPTEVHDSVSPTNESVAQFESAVSEHMDQRPVVEHQEDALTMNTAVSEPFSQPVEDSVISSAGSGAIGSGSVDMLSESVAQEAPQSVQTFSLDALEAMNSQAPIAPEAQPIAPEAQIAQEGQAVANPQMLSLDEMIAQPNVNTGAVAPVTAMPATGADMPAAAVVGANPLMAPTAYPPVQSPAPNAGYAKLISGIVAGVLFVAVGAMLWIKYPDMIQQVIGGTSSPTPVLEQEQLQEQTPTEAEHNAAQLMPSDATLPEVPVEEIGDVIPDLSAVEVDAPLLSEDIQDIILEQPNQVSEELMQDETGSEAGQEGENPELPSQETPHLLDQSSQSPDVLSAVEDLVGSMAPESVIVADMKLLRQEGETLANLGKDNQNRAMIKWGTYVAKEVEKLQESLANGGKMSTSEWADKKAELKAFLAKATDG